MNPNLNRLYAYPFERLAQLLQGANWHANKTPIAWSIGEPKHPAPDFVSTVLAANLTGLSQYPSTKGSDALREIICTWLTRRYGLPTNALDPARHVLPVNGTREALFAFTQTVVDQSSQAIVAMPNPFYQIYEGATLLAGAEPYFLNCAEGEPDLNTVPENIWQRCQLIYVCSPNNPSGTVLSIWFYRQLLELADRYNFIVAADECYSEIYQDERAPPLGLLQVCAQLGRDDFRRCIIFNSLSKRSSLPGLRSGFVAGDAELIQQFLLYRTYHGSAMSMTTQALSIAAWNDEAHVHANRRLYREKFQQVAPILASVLPLSTPPAGFFLWPELPARISAKLPPSELNADEVFTQQLFQQQNITVLPGSYLARRTDQGQPGEGRLRMALVAPLQDCIEAAERIRSFISAL